jgi:hypothetical protein
MQSMPKALKKLAYGNWDAWEVYLPQNYDIRSCHLAIIAQLCREEGHPLPILEAYVAEKDAKYAYAARAQMDVHVWKAALVSLFYGAVLGKTKKASLYRKIWGTFAAQAEEEGRAYTAVEVEVAYEHFLQIGVPFLQARNTWLQILQDKIVPKMTSTNHTIINPVGARMMRPETWNAETLREVSAFVCQGYEAAFINHLMILSTQYRWKNLSIEHDGLVVDGRIPPEAMEEARKLSGFYTASLEETGF